MNTLKVEIFGTGVWHGIDFSAEDLKAIVYSFNKFKENLHVPLKFGHNDEQEMTDGKPALGWVTDLSIEGDKLIAEFSDMPDIVFNAMKKNLYRHVSVELEMGVEYKGENFMWVLTGVALLGADLPAVNTLSDLKAYMSKREGMKTGKSVKFSIPNKTGGNKMKTAEQLQAELDAANATIKAQTDQIGKMSKDNSEMSVRMTKIESEQKARAESEQTAKFAAAKQKLEKSLDDLVKAKKILPAVREKFMKQWKDDDATVAHLQFSVDIMGENNGKVDEKEQGHEGTKTKSEEGKQPDEVIRMRAKSYMLKSGEKDFSKAVKAVMEEDTELAEQYRDMNGIKATRQEVKHV